MFMVVMLMGLVIVVVVAVFSMFIIEAAQGQFRHFIQAPCAGLAVEQLLQKALQIRANPLETISVGNSPAVGWTQRVIVRGGARWQQYFGFSDTLKYSGSDQLHGFDSGQHTGRHGHGRCGHPQPAD